MADSSPRRVAPPPSEAALPPPLPQAVSPPSPPGASPARVSGFEPPTMAATRPPPPTQHPALARAQSVRVGPGRDARIVQQLPTVAADQAMLASAFEAEEAAPEGEEEGGAPPPPALAPAPAPSPPTTAPAATGARGDYTVDEHKLSIAAVCARLGTHVDESDAALSRGLAPQEAAFRLQRDGRNELTPPKGVPEWRKYVAHLGDLLMVLLELAAGLSFLAFGLDATQTDNAILGGVLIVLVLTTSFMAYWQEARASDVINSIKKMLPADVKVLRGGRESTEPAASLVVGDVVHLTIGNRVPADIRVVQAADFKVEVSSLTGESDAIECGPEKRSELVAESRNVIFSSSLVMNGEAFGVVVRTGDATFIGTIAGLAGETRTSKTTMELEILRVCYIIAAMALVFGVVFLAIGLGRGLGIVFSFVDAFILVLIANVPEGLPATVAAVLNLTAQKLAGKNVFIKRTELIETLGSASVICSDKTGTLTTNRMTVENLWLCGSFARARGLVRRAAPTAAEAAAEARVIAGQTIGRGMSFVAFGGPRRADVTALIHSTTGGVGLGLPSTAIVHRAGTLLPPALGAELLPSAGPEPTAEMDEPSPEGIAQELTGFGAGLQAQLPPPLPPQSLPQSPPQGGESFDEGGPEERGNLAAAEPPPVTAATLGSASFAPHVSFMAYAGLCSANWAAANAFTRLVAIAAVCNKATFGEATPSGVEPAVAPVMLPVTTDGSISRYESFIISHRPPPVQPAPHADQRVVFGDASEAALLRYADGLAPIAVWRRCYPLVFEVPFNSESKYALTVVPLPEDPRRRHLVMMKGAPERVVDRCSHYFRDGEERSLDAAFRTGFEKAYERFGVMGERVLGFAYKVVAVPPEFSAGGGYKSLAPQQLAALLLEGLCFVSLVSLVDPPKKGVPEAVAKCRSASIRVTMVTGDHPLTAEAIARKVGIITLPTAREVAHASGVAEADIELTDPRVRALVLPGFALPRLAEADWDRLLSKEEVVFARTSPQQKLQIVEHYQRLGHIVAVTGDGTNDAPALKKADIGVSMGSAAASDVAREAGDMIIMDDDFASIVFAIEEGRVVFDNLKKTIAYTVTHLWPELIPVFCQLTFDVPLMLPGLILLVVDCVTEQAPAISLSQEPAEASVMARPPRDLKTERLVDMRLVIYSYCVMGCAETLVCILAFFTVFSWYRVPVHYVGFHRELWTSTSPTLVADNGEVFDAAKQVTIYYTAVSAYFLTLVLCQFWHIFLAKTRRVSVFAHPIFANRATLVGVAVAVTVASFCIYVPAINSFFNLAALNGIWWTPSFVFLAFALAFTEGYKAAARAGNGCVLRYLAW